MYAVPRTFVSSIKDRRNRGLTVVRQLQADRKHAVRQFPRTMTMKWRLTGHGDSVDKLRGIIKSKRSGGDRGARVLCDRMPSNHLFYINRAPGQEEGRQGYFFIEDLSRSVRATNKQVLAAIRSVFERCPPRKQSVHVISYDGAPGCGLEGGSRFHGRH